MGGPRVVPVGGGHAHLRVLRALERDHGPARWTLVSPWSKFIYSGMVPGFLQGTYAREQIEIDLADGALLEADAVA